MTPEQEDLVRSSFGKLEALGDRVAVMFYGRLFELDPSLRALFKGRLRPPRP